MPLRFLGSVLVFAVASMMAMPLRAAEVDDIEALYHSGKTDEAIAKADAVIAAQPRAAQVRFLKGAMLIDLNRNDEAIQVFTSLTQDYPELPDPYNNLAVIYASKGQLQAALAALQIALRNDPKHRVAQENLGDLYLVLARQAWASAQSESKGDDAELVRKQRLAHEILPQASPAPVLRPRTTPPPSPPTMTSPLRRSQPLDSSAVRRIGP